VPAVLALGFLVLTVGVWTKGSFLRLDLFVDSHVPGRDDGPQVLHDVAMGVITLANPPDTTVALLVVALGWGLLSRSWWPVLASAPAVLAMASTVLLVKWLVDRPGPPGSGPVGSFGAFPSGHTATALVCAATLAALVGFVRPRWRTAARVAAAAWALLVGGSVVWVHYHLLTDVLGSFLLGSLVLWLCYRWPWSLHR
jgi:membrane-associated phospholipid phosphatase